MRRVGSLARLRQALLSLSPTPKTTPMTETTELAKGEPKYALMKEEAKILSGSQLIPTNYQGKPQDCYVALQAANRMGCDPLLFLQNTYVVHGRPAQSAKFQIALINQSGKLKGGLRWKVSASGDYQAWGIDAETGEEITGPVVNMELAKAEGWTKNPKYKSMPDLMLRYRSATMFIGLYFPDVTMGFQTAEEVHDLVAAGTLPGTEEAALPQDLQLNPETTSIPDKASAEEATTEPAQAETEDERPEDILAAQGDPEVLGEQAKAEAQPMQGGLLG